MLNNELPAPNLSQIGKHQKFVIDVLICKYGSQIRVRVYDGHMRMDNIAVVDSNLDFIADVQGETFDSLIQRNILVPAGKQRLTVSLNRQYYILNPRVIDWNANKKSSTTKK